MKTQKHLPKMGIEIQASAAETFSQVGFRQSGITYKPAWSLKYAFFFAQMLDEDFLEQDDLEGPTLDIVTHMWASAR